MLTKAEGGIVGEAIGEVKVSPFRCERCGCGLICGPKELLLCSTCLPAEVVELRAELIKLKNDLGSVSPPLLWLHERDHQQMRRRLGSAS